MKLQLPILLLALCLFSCNKDKLSPIPEEIPTISNCPPDQSVPQVGIIEIFQVVEEMPYLFGCEGPSREERANCNTAIIETFLSENLNYPAEAMCRNIEGTVIIRAIITPAGCLEDIKVVQDIGYGCGQEAQRAISLMTNWVPGKQRGVAVKTFFNFPVVFNL